MPQEATQDLSSLPNKEVRAALVESFFTDINPGFPVVDKAEFRMKYEDQKYPPPLLLHQIIGAHACKYPNVVHSRSIVKAIMFRRAKDLFDL